MEHGDVATLEAADSQQTLLLVLRGMQAWAGLSSTTVMAAYPAIRGLTQCGISKVLAPSFFADGKSLDES